MSQQRDNCSVEHQSNIFRSFIVRSRADFGGFVGFGRVGRAGPGGGCPVGGVWAGDRVTSGRCGRANCYHDECDRVVHRAMMIIMTSHRRRVVNMSLPS